MILGGDLSFSLSLREATGEERAFIESHGRMSLAATMRAMARTPDGRTALVEMKAVDAAYPLYGTVTLDPPQPLSDALAQRDGAYGAAADPALLARLDLKPGARITVGSAPIEIRAVLTSEPDKLAGGIGFGPRLLVSEAALRATGLVQPGSVVRWHYRLRLPDNAAGDEAVKAVSTAAQAQLPEAGWEIRSRTSASPALERNVERFTQYLTLVGLTALLVGGVGVANAVKSHLDRRRDVIATLKSLGATGSTVFAIYLTQVVTLALIGALPGLLVGAALPFLIAWGFGTLLPLPLAPAIHPAGLALAMLYGVLTAVAFGLWPLGRAHDVPVSALFRDTVAGVERWPRRSYVIATALVVSALAAIAIELAFDRRIAVVFVVAAAGVFVLLRLVAALLMMLARRAPRPRSPVVRLAIANIHRPGSADAERRAVARPRARPARHRDRDRRQSAQAVHGGAARQGAVLLLHRYSGGGCGKIRCLRASARAGSDASNAFRCCAGASWRRTAFLPTNSSRRPIPPGRCKAIAALPTATRFRPGRGWSPATWWKPDYQGPPLVSFEKRIADGLGLKVGDAVTVNVLGRNMQATVANLRTLDWQSLGINFVMVFSPNSFRGAPHTHIATLGYPGGSTTEAEVALLKAVADAFPTVTTVRVREALDAVGSVVNNLVLAIRGASALTLIVAVLVLGGALAAGHRHRVYDAVILKTVGATRGQAAVGLCAGISRARIGHRGVRRRRRHGVGRFRRHQGDESVVRVAARTGADRRRACGGDDDGARPCRHLYGARPEARAGAAQSVSSAARRRAISAALPVCKIAKMPSGWD